ncbi:rod shape-determining protein [Sporocytophaga myxococcoides]|uniref:rod shape-determining protein n=1 Tax=Sporocytophaga myxococcoides TaxID=153721 RepID=UPI000412DE24|nr:rod shape-determining protein [Sporocytophaga myxococcoides]
MGLLNFLKDSIGIDPGSQHLRIIKDGELVFNESSQISFNISNNSISGLGDTCSSSELDVTIKPVDYAIADFHAFEALLRGAIKKGLGSKSIFPKTYKMYYCIPTNSTQIEKRAYRDSGEHAGASEVYMIYQSYCTAVGLNLLFEKKDFILIDFSFSKIEITVFVDSIPISVGVIKMGTSKIFRLFKNFLRRKYNLNISDKEVESILKGVNNVQSEIKIQSMTIKVSEIHNLLDNLFVLVNDEFMETIERVNIKDIGKVMKNGVYFSGGGSAIDFLRDKIQIDREIKRTTSKNPMLDNINGLMKIIAEKDKFRSYFIV